jgi:serine/threonine protein kinase
MRCGFNFYSPDASISPPFWYCDENKHATFVFRDIKPENFVFSSSDDDATLRLADFGLSAAITTPDEVLTKVS